MSYEIRPYRPADMDTCLAIFDSNVPKYFDPGERADFQRYLAQGPNHYFVVQAGKRFVACGGYHIDESSDHAGMTWGMVVSSDHRRGIGTVLTAARIDDIQRRRPELSILLDTSQHTVRFYERFGFVTQSITSDGYGPGLDKYDMVLEPAVQTGEI